MASDDRRRFDMATMRFVAGLNNGHTAFDDRWLWQAHGAPTGLEVVRAGSDWIIQRSAHASAPPGAQILTLDGAPIEEAAASLMPFVSGSSERERTRKLFARAYLFPDTFHLTLDSGEAAIRRGAALPPRPMAPSLEWHETGRIARLRVPSFAEAAHEAKALHLLGELPPARALVVDLRGNSGGDTPERLVTALMPQAYRFWRAETPFHDALRLAKGEAPGRRPIEPEWIEAMPGAFAGPMAILVDGGTLSAAEDFALPFKDNGRALLVGEATGGSSGQPARFDLGDGMRLWVGAKRQFLPNGSAFEGVGLAPDIAVKAAPPGEPDRVLLAALATLA